MKNRIKILFVFGTRPEAVKMAPIIKECEKNHKKFNVRICVTAQHREMLDQALDLFCIEPHYDLNIMTKRQSLSDLTANVLLGITKVIKKEKPDIVFVQGDTTTTFAAAQAAYYQKTPVSHIEAGLRTKNKYSPFPEEINRRLTSALSDLHFTPTKEAKANLIAEGFSKSSIYTTGNTVIDSLEFVLAKHKKRIANKKWQNWFLSKYNISFSNSNIKTILVTGHRRESFGAGFKNICKALRLLAKNNSNIQFVYPVHLNPNVQEPVYSIIGDMSNVYLIPPLEYEAFVFLMSTSDIILTDSGGVQEEAPTIGAPVLVMRDTSERPEGIKAGFAKLVGTNTKTIVNETQKLLKKNKKFAVNKINPYGDGKASQRIVKIILEHFRRNI